MRTVVSCGNPLFGVLFNDSITYLKHTKTLKRRTIETTSRRFQQEQLPVMTVRVEGGKSADRIQCLRIFLWQMHSKIMIDLENDGQGHEVHH